MALAVALAVPQIVALVGASYTVPAVPVWYATLAKPALSPPNWLFGPVWTALYLLMGTASFLVWRAGALRKDVRVRDALAMYGAQLALNAAWSAVFFGLRSPGTAFAVIAALWAAILATIVVFRRISRTAALLLLPYILWVTFAAYLNYWIWVHN